MKIESIAVRHEAAGNLVEVGFRLQGNEELEAEDIARVYNLLNEIGGERKTTATSTEALKTAEEPAPQPTEGRRRRRGNALGDPEPAAPAAEPAADPQPPEGRRRRRSEGQSAENPTSPAVTPTATEAPTASDTGDAPTRRRRRSAPDAEGQQPTPTSPVQPANAGSTEEPTRRRRRSAEAAPSADTSPTPGPSEAGRRRRRAEAAVSTEASPAQSPSDISDADLSKAASLGAQKLTPKVVQAYLAELGVKSVNELKGDQRRAFLDGIKAKTEAAS